MFKHSTLRLAAVGLVAALSSSACGDAPASEPSPDAGATTDAGDTTSDAISTACSTEATDGADSLVATDVNGWTVSVNAVTGAWSVEPAAGGEAVLSGPGSCERDGDEWRTPVRLASGEPETKESFGNFDIQLESQRSRLEWRSTANVAPKIEQSDGGVLIRWPLDSEDSDDATAELKFMAEGDDNLTIELASSVESLATGEIAMSCQPSEAFFGLGSQATGMDLRGRTYPLWTQEQGNGKPEDGGIFPLNNTPEAAYAPMGIWHSSMGYSAIIGHDRYSEIDLCEDSVDTVHLRSHSELPKFVLVAGETPKERLGAITEYTGRLDPAPPAWVFGPWFDAVDGPDRLEEVATTLRENAIPASAIWTEDWIGGSSTSTGFRLSYAWEWSQETYPDLPAQIDDLHDQGFAFLAYFNPFVPQTVPMFDEGSEAGYLIKDEDGEDYLFQDPAFRWASMVDLTNPDAIAWLADYQTTAADELGIDGWMADFAEWLPTDAALHSGESGWEFHNRYPLAWQEANRHALSQAHSDLSPSNDWTFFARSGWASTHGGSAGLAPTMWGGDQNTDWKYDDGFPTIVPIGAHLGMSGVAIFGSDIAGYNSLGTTNTDKELFFRWSATAAFHPLMRTHHGGDECENWNFDRDSETLIHFRRYASIHTLLYPYFDRLVAEAMQDGLPITRHPYLVEDDHPALWTGDQYTFFVGDDLLVAPVLERGATTRTVTIPTQGWWPLLGDEPLLAAPVQGNAFSAEVDVPVTETPVFVRPGSIVPLLSEVVDSFYGASADGLTDLEDVDEALRLALYPDVDGHVELVEREGLSAFGTGWGDVDDWSQAGLDEAVLPECAGADSHTSCIDPDARTVRLIDVESSTLRVGPGTLELEANEPTDFVVGVGGAAWGEFADPTPFSGLNADAPSWCGDAATPD
jgi:alpha-glucosidase (family GH31 glycosyl hydrolase)